MRCASRSHPFPRKAGEGQDGGRRCERTSWNLRRATGVTYAVVEGVAVQRRQDRIRPVHRLTEATGDARGNAIGEGRVTGASAQAGELRPDRGHAGLHALLGDLVIQPGELAIDQPLGIVLRRPETDALERRVVGDAGELVLLADAEGLPARDVEFAGALQHLLLTDRRFLRAGDVDGGTEDIVRDRARAVLRCRADARPAGACAAAAVGRNRAERSVADAALAAGRAIDAP